MLAQYRCNQERGSLPILLQALSYSTKGTLYHQGLYSNCDHPVLQVRCSHVIWPNADNQLIIWSDLTNDLNLKQSINWFHYQYWERHQVSCCAGLVPVRSISDMWSLGLSQILFHRTGRQRTWSRAVVSFHNILTENLVTNKTKTSFRKRSETIFWLRTFIKWPCSMAEISVWLQRFRKRLA